jgi:hypothetical protein
MVKQFIAVHVQPQRRKLCATAALERCDFPIGSRGGHSINLRKGRTCRLTSKSLRLKNFPTARSSIGDFRLRRRAVPAARRLPLRRLRSAFQVEK